MLPQMLSHAQNGEDVVLRRAFAGQATGFYVDIGACSPVEDSVTLHFYEQGWRGVNVEPDARWHAALSAARPRDINLRAAVGRGDTPVEFFPTGTRGHGTLDPGIAAGRSAAPSEMVPQIPLARLLAEHAPPEGVDFLKIDVEGWEEAVLASADWRQVRPRVVLVEAVDTEGRPTHQTWESPLLAAGYRFALFDGLNRFYVREEDAAALLPRLAAPANVLDNYRLAREARAQAAMPRKRAAAREPAEPARRAGGAVAAITHRTQEAGQLAARVSSLQEEVRSLTLSLEEEQREHARTRDALGASLQEIEWQRAALAASGAPTSWRIPRPLRHLLRRLRRGGS